MRTPSSQKCRLDLAPPLADRFILGMVPSIAARHFSSCPSDSALRWTPCPPEYSKQWLQVSLGSIQLSLSCPFRPLHTFCFLRPARLLPPAFGYGAPHLSARGTLTLQNNALLSTHFRVADAQSLVSRFPPSVSDLGKERQNKESRDCLALSVENQIAWPIRNWRFGMFPTVIAGQQPELRIRGSGVAAKQLARSFREHCPRPFRWSSLILWTRHLYRVRVSLGRHRMVSPGMRGCCRLSCHIPRSVHHH
jgi:hypothetical protein